MRIKLSRSQWENIGKTAGWMKMSQDIPQDDVNEDELYDQIFKKHVPVEEAVAKALKIPTNTRWEICDRCRGEGRTDNPSLQSTSGPSLEEQFAEDPDFKEDYFSGAYDVTCEVCKGSGKVRVSEPMFDKVSPEIKARYQELVKEKYNSLQEFDNERSMRARGIQF